MREGKFLVSYRNGTEESKLDLVGANLTMDKKELGFMLATMEGISWVLKVGSTTELSYWTTGIRFAKELLEDDMTEGNGRLDTKKKTNFLVY